MEYRIRQIYELVGIYLRQQITIYFMDRIIIKVQLQLKQFILNMIPIRMHYLFITILRRLMTQLH